MSPLSPPPIDPRTYDDFVRETEALVERYTGWRPPAEDPAGALVRVFAKMAERVAGRLNRMPDRAFLAFLDLVGVRPRPPQPARAPLTFFLAAGAGDDAVVPARTPVAGRPLEGETAPAVFETERELVVTRTTLEAVVVHDPARDRWADRTAHAAAATPFSAFAGDAPLTHRLHLSHAAFAARTPKTVRLRVHLDPAEDAHWPEVEWSWRDTAGDHPLPASDVSRTTPFREMAFTGLPAVPVAEVAGVQGAWLSGRLRTPLRLRDALPAAVLAGGAWEEPGATLFPFGRTEPAGFLALSAPEVLALPGAVATLRVELDAAYPAPAGDGALVVEWEYRAGAEWAPLGASSPGQASADDADPPAFSDETRALTRGGTVTFRVPADWTESELEGRRGHWLRARVAAGGYGAEDGFLPPAVRRLSLGYDLPVPGLTAVEARVEASGSDLLLPAAYAGAAELDLSADFLPFGERPARGDVFYLAVPELLDRPDARATLWFTLESFPADAPAAGPQPTLRWEYPDAAAGRWLPFGESAAEARALFGYEFRDDTASLTRTGERLAVSFRAPALGQVEVNGRLGAWIRVRITGGEYGRDARYEGEPAHDPAGNPLYDAAGSPIIVHRLLPPTWRPPTVRALALDYAYASPWTAADAVVAENDGDFAAVEPAAGALPPFQPFTLPADPRPSLYLGFRRPGDAAGFANRAATLYVGPAEIPFGEAPGEEPAEPAVLAWWYWDGAGWARLGVLDETAAFTRRGLVTFVGPADFRASARFGREAFWMRVTVERGGWRHAPRLERVLLNTVWAEHATLVAGEVLGSGTGKPGLRLRTVHAPVLPGERIEVREPGLSPAEREALEREGGPGAVAVSGGERGQEEVWVRWTPVVDFHGSGPASRHYVVDRLTGEVRFGDGVHGRAAPPGRANLRAALYRTGGGPEGNRPTGNLAQLRTPVPYVDRVANPEPAAGGAAAEPLDQVRDRGPRTLRHRDRAVTLSDLEDLALEASPEVAVARAVPPADLREAGRVRVLVVPRAARGRPVPSLELLDRVHAHLAERLPATVELEVLGPEWVEVAVTVEVAPVTPGAAGQVHTALAARLADFLHPLAGGPGGGGWPFGRRPWRSDLYALVEAVPGVDHVRLLEVRETPLPRTPWFLVHSGAHTVRVAGPAAG
ncbi:MAG TPA: putative baseplate assembly protein [Longimicrobium sp.]|nr:putative baseplate assembly protein [Longimicrobium sp.]